MNKKAVRLPYNAAGRYYVNSECIDCDICRGISPANFARNEDTGLSYVTRQPADDTEISLCAEALEACPVEAIEDGGTPQSEI